MLRKIFAYSQFLAPQHFISYFFGRLANARTPWLKNLLIKQFMRSYNIDLTLAQIENPTDYANFNDFFIRHLKTDLRPLDPTKDAIVSPVDGILAEFGHIQQQQLLQAKQFYYDLDTLITKKEIAQHFYNGEYATLYLAPYHYHRVHMPIDGKLLKTIYIPGRLFSVNRATIDHIPNLYSRNERLVALFQTQAGLMAVILVGAMIVGSMQTMWMPTPYKHAKILEETFTKDITLKKGEELGYFKMGSTVILLFEPNKAAWSSFLQNDLEIQFGKQIGSIIDQSATLL